MRLLDNLRLRQKLTVLIGVLLALVAVTVFTQWALSRANHEISAAYQQRYDSYLLADELRQSSDDLTRLARNFVVTGEPMWRAQYDEVAAIRAGEQPRPAGYEGIYWDFRAAGIDVPGNPGEAVALLELMKRAGFTDAELEQLAIANQLSGELAKTEARAMNLAARAGIGDFDTNATDMERARTLLHGADYHRTKAEIMVPIAKFFGLLDDRTGAAVQSAEAAASRWQLIQMVSGVIALAIFFLTLYTIFGRIIASARQAVAASSAVARGDLTHRVEASGRDEIAELLRSLMSMRASLAGMVQEVRQGSDSIAVASRQIATGNQDLSQRTEEQASSLEETASSMEELTSTVRQNADNARQANQLAATASDVATRGGSVVSEVVTTMESITESSKKIEDIISVIDGIAFQTNILALNAAVEAARAGEQGRGFAVVASEVRSLAQRSAAAAKEIKTLIDDSVSKVSTGSELVESAGQTMAEIVSSVKRVTDIMGEITAASQEQASGIEQVNQAVAQMDQVTQQNAALVEEASAATESMRTQAAQLSEVVGRFQLDSESQAPLAGSERHRGGQSLAPNVARLQLLRNKQAA